MEEESKVVATPLLQEDGVKNKGEPEQNKAERKNKKPKRKGSKTRVSKTLKPNVKVFLKSVVLKLAILITALFIVFHFLIGVCYVTGNNMFPNVKDGDLIITWKLSDLQRNDVVIYENDDGKNVVGRVVALAGDTITFTQGGQIKVNGAITSEEVFYSTDYFGEYDETYSVTVPEDSVYILNDYRSGSSSSYKDSRTYGTIELSKVHGSAILQLRRREF